MPGTVVSCKQSHFWPLVFILGLQAMAQQAEQRRCCCSPGSLVCLANLQALHGDLVSILSQKNEYRRRRKPVGVSDLAASCGT